MLNLPPYLTPLGSWQGLCACHPGTHPSTAQLNEKVPYLTRTPLAVRTAALTFRPTTERRLH